MSDRDARPLIHVVAGVLIDATGRVLIAQRPPGKHMAGGWEFPGGKVEMGEERRTALARELREELGVDIVTASLRPLIRVRHAYPAREVLLDTWVVKQFIGEPRGLDGQALRWCTLCELTTAELLPADAPIVEVICDAQRGDLFAGKFTPGAAGHWVPQRPIRQISAAAWANEINSADTVSGPGLDKYSHLFEGRCRVLTSEFRRPHAVWVGRLGLDQSAAGVDADLWGVEPLYLRRSSAETQWEKLHPSR